MFIHSPINFTEKLLNPKEIYLLNFLKSKFDNYHEQVVKQVVKQYFIEEKMSDITLRRKSLNTVTKSLSI